MKKVFVVEDDKIQSEQLCLLLEELGYWVIGKSDNALEAFSMITEVYPDVILLDVNIKGEKTGIDVAKELRATGLHSKLLFISSLEDDETFDRAKASAPFDFIIKPISKRKLKRSLDLCFQEIEPTSRQDENVITVKSEGVLHRIDLSRLSHVEVRDKHCYFFLLDEESSINVRMPFSEVLDRLEEADEFLQVHRSFIVNKSLIRGFDLTMQRLKIGEFRVPVSKRFRSTVEALFI